MTAERIECDDLPACRVCGCTEERACAGGCWWVDDGPGGGDLCSACAGTLRVGWIFYRGTLPVARVNAVGLSTTQQEGVAAAFGFPDFPGVSRGRVGGFVFTGRTWTVVGTNVRLTPRPARGGVRLGRWTGARSTIAPPVGLDLRKLRPSTGELLLSLAGFSPEKRVRAVRELARLEILFLDRTIQAGSVALFATDARAAEPPPIGVTCGEPLGLAG
jgi:hypothetical protein